MTLFSYIVTHDSGFAPNPFFGYCTLACCKPDIRRVAQKDHWVVGLTPKAQGNAVVYFMRVGEVLDYPGYWTDDRFNEKKPRHDGDGRQKVGDNIYEPLPDGEREHCMNKKKDIDGYNVLISETFAYFGSKPLPLPRIRRTRSVGCSRFTPYLARSRRVVE